jgi:hypothetical protein
MDCPRCNSGNIRAAATNGANAEHVIRKRACTDCGHAWFTVELAVSPAVVGWGRIGPAGQSKPVLRVPVEIAVGSEAV